MDGRYSRGGESLINLPLNQNWCVHDISDANSTTRPHIATERATFWKIMQFNVGVWQYWHAQFHYTFSAMVKSEMQRIRLIITATRCSHHSVGGGQRFTMAPSYYSRGHNNKTFATDVKQFLPEFDSTRRPKTHTRALELPRYL